MTTMDVIQKLKVIQEKILGLDIDTIQESDFAPYHNELQDILTQIHEFPPEDRQIVLPTINEFSQSLGEQVNHLQDRLNTLRGSMEYADRHLRGMRAYHGKKRS